MYYIEDVINRTFEGWGGKIHASDAVSFWTTSSTFEMKPNFWSTYAETTAQSSSWESSDSNETNWDKSADSVSDDWSTESDDSTSDSDSWSDSDSTSDDAGVVAMSEIADTASSVLADVNPYSSQSNSDEDSGE